MDKIALVRHEYDKKTMVVMRWLVCFSEFKCVGLSPQRTVQEKLPQEALTAATFCCCCYWFVNVALFRSKAAALV